MANIKVIVNAAIRTHTKQEISAREQARYEICRVCPQASSTIYYKVIPDEVFVDIKGKRCKKCGCSLSYKIRSEDVCPIGKWSKIDNFEHTKQLLNKL
jgi:hypothetical protein